ncbi:MAG: adenosylhomocysteinase [bacterium]|nr:adenosylhomocysteinase [bacterium]
MRFDVKDLSLATGGRRRIDWAERQMDVLDSIRRRFEKKKPLKGARIAACLHVTAETAVLMRTLKSGGADVTLVASNPLSTQDDVAASLVKHDRIPVYAITAEGRDIYYQHLNIAIDTKPNITMDDGADLVTLLHTKRSQDAGEVWGSTEETTTGVVRLKSLEREGLLMFPAIAVNESKTKHLFDNRYGTGQSTIDGIVRATNILLCGKAIVVVGYGWCGRGFAARARGMGAHVIITEVDAVKALEATMDGFVVLPMIQAVEQADVIVTLTGNRHVVDAKHFPKMKDGVILCNSGHFDCEINLEALEKLATTKRMVRDFTEEYTLKSKKHIIVLGEGRIINLTSAEGHPASVMDMSFANQALAAEFITTHRETLEKKVYTLPPETDVMIAELKLQSMGVVIDKLTKEQQNYLNSWQTGT